MTAAWIIVSSIIAQVSFLAAFSFPDYAWAFIVLHLNALYIIATRANAWQAFGISLIVALSTIIPTLWFFWGMMDHKQAIGLWMMLASWQVFPVVISNLFSRRAVWTRWLTPVFWTLALYARCELYPLRFTMATPIHALTGKSANFLHFGGYGFVFIVLSGIALLDWLFTQASQSRHSTGSKLAFAVFGLLGIAALPVSTGVTSQFKTKGPVVVGIQGTNIEPICSDGKTLQFRSETNIISALDAGYAAHPEGRLFVLPEYSIPGEPSEGIKDWCQQHRAHLVIGGKKTVGEDFFNTAFVVDSHGKIVFQQAKIQPVHGLPDGLPAGSQTVWDSPWGKIGILICYDLSLTRACDGLARQGARAIICPAMDLVAWGKQEHLMNARFAQQRAVEYDIPVLRVASSGISQLVYPDRKIVAEASCNSAGITTLSGVLPMGKPALLPIDRELLGNFPSFASPLAIGGMQ